jgi:hypothetical protein
VEYKRWLGPEYTGSYVEERMSVYWVVYEGRMRLGWRLMRREG